MFGGKNNVIVFAINFMYRYDLIIVFKKETGEKRDKIIYMCVCFVSVDLKGIFIGCMRFTGLMYVYLLYFIYLTSFW